MIIQAMKKTWHRNVSPKFQYSSSSLVPEPSLATKTAVLGTLKFPLPGMVKSWLTSAFNVDITTH